METIFNVLDYSAVGDGKTDCTGAFQLALDKAGECMGKVVIPPGKYAVGQLKAKGLGISIQGTSAYSYRSDGGTVLLLNDDSADCMIDISGAFGCSIRGICMDGRGLGDPKAHPIHGIKLYWDEYNGGGEEDNPRIDECRIGNFSGDGIHLEHAWCFSVRHSMIHHNGRNGLFISGWDGFVLDNWFSLNSGWGIRGGEVSASITITGNRVEWNHLGGFHFPYGDSYNITGNFFDRSFGPALSLGGSQNVSLATITGNIFRRSGAYTDVCHSDEFDNCHVKLQNCSDVTMLGNTMRVGKNDGGGGVLSPDYGFIIRNCHECIIKDNTMMTGALKELIIAEDNKNCIIRNNIGTLSDENWSTGSELLN